MPILNIWAAFLSRGTSPLYKSTSLSWISIYRNLVLTKCFIAFCLEYHQAQSILGVAPPGATESHQGRSGRR